MLVKVYLIDYIVNIISRGKLTMMIKREWLQITLKQLNQFPAVGLLGARQIGKTTLALEVSKLQPAIYLDLENERDLIKLSDPLSYFESHQDKLIILDEIQRCPELFSTLRVIIDQKRRQWQRVGQFLILGSASIELLKQSSESLAGRICYIEMGPLSASEVKHDIITSQQLWLRGGFPDRFLAAKDQSSLDWRYAFIKTYLERDIPQFGPKIPTETLKRLWIMLAHSQGSLLNAAKLATSLSISSQTVSRYIDLLTDLFLVRKLRPWSNNTKKRLIKSPKIYVRDSGIVHALLNIQDNDMLLSHPVLGYSWEGFVIDNLLTCLPSNSDYYFYRTVVGAEIDLLIQLPNNKTIAIEIKHSSIPKIERGFHEACNDLNPTYRYVVYQGQEKFKLKDDIYAIDLLGLMHELVR